MVLLKQIIDSTDAKIVLTTSWREHWDKDISACDNIGIEINEIFSEYSMTIFDKTPQVNRNREDEIEMWLNSHKSIESFAVGNETLDIRGLEQLKDYEQTTTLAYLTKYSLEKMEQAKGKETLERILEKTWEVYERKGMEGILSSQNMPADYAKVRKQDYYACFHRYRGFFRV